MKAKTKNFLRIIKNFQKTRILVVGDIMLDEYIFGDVEKISPEAPIQILDLKEIRHIPGGAANVVRNIKALGGKIFLTGVIGPEDKGKILKRVLVEGGTNTEGIFIDPKRKTTVKTRVVARNQQIIRIDSENRNWISSKIENKILNFIKKRIKDIDAIIISDYAKGVVSPRLSQNIIKIAKDNKIFCLIDPKGRDYLKYKGCNIITPNAKELAQALNVQVENESQFLEAGKMLLSHVMCDNVLVTRGAKGMTLFERNGAWFHSPADNMAGKVVDITGAGDTAAATFALALTAGANLKQAMMIANYACGVVVTKAGAAVVLPEELEKRLKTYEKKQN